MSSDSDDSDFGPENENHALETTDVAGNDHADDSSTASSCPWKSAVDPGSGRTYYYHSKTRETQWRKPVEMASKEERDAIAEKEKRQKEFFSAMEANILKSIYQGMKAPEKQSKLDVEHAAKEISDDPLTIATTTAVTATQKESPRVLEHAMSPVRDAFKQQQQQQQQQGRINRAPRPNLVRTISSMDTNAIRELMKRVPSSRQVARAAPPFINRQQILSGSSHGSHSLHNNSDLSRLSNHSSASSHHFADGSEVGQAAVHPNNNNNTDLRLEMSRADSLKLDAIQAAMMGERKSSKNLEQIMNEGGGIGSHLSLSETNSFGPIGGSFGSLPSMSENEIHFGAGEQQESSLTSINAHASLSSNLQPVAEGLDESEQSNHGQDPEDSKKKKKQWPSGIPETDNDNDSTHSDNSFSLDVDLMNSGKSISRKTNTANLLDALPTANSFQADVVGYGHDRKPFEDAGFTSFFDESMANFDLSEKETKALQKLAVVTEQMAQIAEDDDFESESEGEEEEEEEELEIGDSKSNFVSPYFEGSEFQLGFEPDDEEPLQKTPTHTNKSAMVPAQKEEDSSPDLAHRRGKKLMFHTTEEDEGQSQPTFRRISSDPHVLEEYDDSPSTSIEKKAGENKDVAWEPPSSSNSDNKAQPPQSPGGMPTKKAMRLRTIDRTRIRPGGRISPDFGNKRGGTSPPLDSDGKRAGRPDLVRRNTCGTLYVGTTMSAPDKDATIKCVCGVYRAHIIQSEMEEESDESVNFRIFNDLESQQGLARREPNRSKHCPRTVTPLIPSLEQITTFYRDVFQRAQMEYDCIIISLIYVERLIKTTQGALRPRGCNWRSILFSCMVLASKVWDDLSMWNADFSQACPTGVKFPLKRINELEVAILSALSYKVKVPASEYAKYYFLLRSMLIKSGLVDDTIEATTPLDVEGAKRLQHNSSEFQSGMGASKRNRMLKKTQSMRCKSLGEADMTVMKAGGRRAREKKKKGNLENLVKF